MDETLASFFRGDYMPHGHCYLWQPSLLWTNVISDLLIALAYFSIPLALIIVTRKRKDIKFKGLLILFSSFILLCGLTHAFSIYTVWHGTYGLQGLLKAATAAVSLATAAILILNLKNIIALPSVDKIREALELDMNEELKRMRRESEKKHEAIFKYASEVMHTGLLVIGTDRYIRMANQALEKLFGYEEHELTGMHLNCLIPDSDQAHHDQLVSDYIKHPTQQHAMAVGRTVNAINKNGEEVGVEITLSMREIGNEQLIFASMVGLNEMLTEEKLALETTNRIRRAINATNNGIWEWNPQSNQVWYSPRLLAMIGHQPDTKASFELWRDHVHPDDRQHVFDLINEHFASKTEYDVVYRGMTDTGEYQWMNARGNTLFDDKQRPLLMSGTLTNIHHIKTMEAELESQSRFLNEVLSRSLCGFYIFNLNSHCSTYINPAYTDITGYTLEDLNQPQDEAAMLELFHPEDRHKIAQHLHEVTGEHPELAMNIEYRLKHKDGHWIWCYSQDSVYSRDSQGRPQEMLGTFFDITELKERERAIQQLATDFSTTFEQAAVGIAHIDFDDVCLKANHKLCEILGYSQDELRSQPFTNFTHADDFDAIQAERLQFMQGDVTQSVHEKRLIKANGQAIWVLSTTAVVNATDSSTPYLIKVIEDITERKTIETRLAESNTALERFAYSASHDMQEPLRKISNFAGILETRIQSITDDEDILFLLDRVTDASRRMGLMIQSLLELSRYARKTLTKNHVKLSEIVAQVQEDLSGLIAEHNAQIELHNDAELYVETNGFQQVIRNIISNSIQYSQDDKPPHIRIEVVENTKTLTIQLSDNGKGANPDKAEQIFEPFRRLSEKQPNNTGMGLAICRQIMQAHGGTINAVTKPNEGMTMILVLPKESP